MADPRELARQAFSLLQSALASSEARAEQLNEELARKPVSKDKLENKVSVLSHRLESVEEECQRWKRETEQLKEVLANERVKFDSLKKKLEIAESGPDKLTKKEVNYWRANAEKFDEQINSYKSRIAALKRELREREQLVQTGQSGPAGVEAPAGDEGENFGARTYSETELANLRQQIATLNAVLADAHAARERLESELTDLRGQLEQAEQRTAGADPADDKLAIDLDRMQQDNARLRASLQLSEAELHELRRARSDLSGELTALKRQIDDDRSSNTDHERQHQLLTAQLEEARARELALQGELDSTRQALANREQQLPAGAVSGAVANELKAELARAQQEAAEFRASLESSTTELAELREAREGLAAELAEVQRRLDDDVSERRDRSRREQELLAAELEATQGREASLRAELAEVQRRLDDDVAERRDRGRREQELAAELEATQGREASLRAELDDSKRAFEGHEEATQALNEAAAAAEGRADEAEQKLVELTAELKEEKEYSENLSELANSRQDQVNKLEDSVEEARERLEDALWRLEKAKYFERLVARRKGLIASLIDALRAKNKAMVALKAGLDSLRTHKAMVEETQQKLLVRMEALKTELGAARKRIKQFEAEAATVSQKAVESTENDEVSALQERLATQAELIRSLEDEVKAAKTYKRNAEEKDGEVAQLHEELETKNTIIARLQSDLDDQQRKLAKLRGSDSETVRLKALTEQDRSKIDVLERENAELRAMIESAEQSQPTGGALTDEREIELQAKIAELTEAVGKWKKKYEFLATEAPAAYQTQTAAKQ